MTFYFFPVVVFAFIFGVFANCSRAERGEEEWTTEGLGFEVGWDYLIDASARRDFGSSGVRVGVSYAPPFDGLFASPLLSVDFARNEKGANRNHTLGVWYSETFRFAGNEALTPYVGAGLGLVHGSARVEREVTEIRGGSPIKIRRTNEASDYGLGARVSAGVVFASGIYLEGSARFASSANDVEQNSVTSSVGFRF